LPLRPNDAIHWQAIHDACREGFRRYDLGEVSEENMGLSRYKRKWGAEPHRLYRYYYPAPRDVGVGILESNRAIRRIAGLIWQRLPLTATALLGEWLYRVV
jgi:serine/alanine adding enzyme